MGSEELLGERSVTVGVTNDLNRCREKGVPYLFTGVHLNRVGRLLLPKTRMLDSEDTPRWDKFTRQHLA